MLIIENEVEMGWGVWGGGVCDRDALEINSGEWRCCLILY